jgi:hypothetical protein
VIEIGKIRIDGGRFFSKNIDLSEIDDEKLFKVSKIKDLAEKVGDSEISDVCEEILDNKDIDHNDFVKKIDFAWMVSDEMMSKRPSFSEGYKKINELCLELSK